MIPKGIDTEQYQKVSLLFRITSVYNASKRSAGCSKVCETDCLRRSVGSGPIVVEHGVESDSATICSMK